MSKRENDGELSKEQWNVLSALERLCEENAYPPTVAELAERLKMRTSSIQNCLNRLIELGHVRKNPGKARGLEVVRKLAPKVFTLVAIPIMGEVPAGVPVLTEEHQDGELLVPAELVGGAKCFALHVVGHSMIDVDILDGDYAVVRQQQLAESGEIVVAAVNGEVTVKTLSMQNGRIALLPANSEFEPIEITHEMELKILGKVIATRRDSASA